MSPPPFLFSLLILPLLAGMIMFVLIRRPREPLTWAFAGIMAGLIVFYLADVVLFQPGLSLYSGLDWQFIQIQGANLTILSALFLNFWLRDKRLQPWEWFIVGFIVLRMTTVMIWQLSLLRPSAPAPCLSLYGVPRITCSPVDRWAFIADAIAGIFVAVLFFSTALQARYIVWATALIVVGSTSLQVLTLAGESGLGVITGQPATLLAILVGLRLFLALEELETGIRFPVLGWRVVVWFVLVLAAMMVDLKWGWLNAPVWTLLVLAVGAAGGAAYLISTLARQGAQVRADGESMPAAQSETNDPITDQPSLPGLDAPLRIYLFGPMRVVRAGDALLNTSEVWRSAKTRSLLAWLALRREAGATQIEIIDALWPVGSEWDSEAEPISRRCAGCSILTDRAAAIAGSSTRASATIYAATAYGAMSGNLKRWPARPRRCWLKASTMTGWPAGGKPLRSMRRKDCCPMRSTCRRRCSSRPARACASAGWPGCADCWTRKRPSG